MTKEREYRAYAGACVDLANKATSDEDNFGGCSRVEGPRRAGGFKEVVVTER